MLSRAKGDLRGVEDIGSVSWIDGSNEHCVSGASHEIPNIFWRVERGHGAAKGLVGPSDCSFLVFFSLQFIPVGAIPGVLAARNGWIIRDSEWWLFHFLSPALIVREKAVIICKTDSGQ
jgi:hypothetical protein